VRGDVHRDPPAPPLDSPRDLAVTRIEAEPDLLQDADLSSLHGDSEFEALVAPVRAMIAGAPKP
jgi:hypothetical protein